MAGCRVTGALHSESPAQTMGRAKRHSAPEAGFRALDRRQSAIARLGPQFLLDAQQLIILGCPVGARQRSGLDLSTTGGNREVGDGGVFGLAGAVRHHRGIGRLVGHLDRSQRLGQGPDLVHLDQDRIGSSVLDAIGKPSHVGDEQVVADQLALAADQVSQLLPAVHVIFGHAVLDRDDRIARHQVGQILRLL